MNKIRSCFNCVFFTDQNVFIYKGKEVITCDLCKDLSKYEYYPYSKKELDELERHINEIR